MNAEHIIGVDSSTQSTKAVAWSRAGEALAVGRGAFPMSHPRDGWCEQDPEDWWRAFQTAVRELGSAIDLKDAAAIAVSNQRETVAFLDAEGGAVRPAIVWLDERAKRSVRAFADAFGADRLHRLTGKPSDLTPVVYRLHWMRENEPAALDRTAAIVDVHGFLTGRLTGAPTASWTSADPFGVFDIAQKSWSAEILDEIGLDAARFAELSAPGRPIGVVSAAAAAATGLPAGLPVIAAGGDGQCAGLGVNAMKSGVAYLNLGTAIVWGAWESRPRISAEWRTMTSPTGVGYFLEGVLRAGTFLNDWFMKSIAGGEAFDRLEAEAEKIALGAEGLLVSPYLSGCMNPHWSIDARAAFFGLQPSHGQAHVYRAMLEALTGEIARGVRAMRSEGVDVERIVVVGGGANSALWAQMIADATQLPLMISRSLEASSLGAAISAAQAVGWSDGFDQAADRMCATDHGRTPSAENAALWEALLDRQDRLNRFVVAETDLSAPLGAAG